jgi:CTP:phosphocholine cytidylyltransferase-like protein
MTSIGNLPPLLQKERIIAIGIEGSANKIGIGIVYFKLRNCHMIF